MTKHLLLICSCIPALLSMYGPSQHLCGFPSRSLRRCAVTVNTDQIINNSRKLKESGGAGVSTNLSPGLAFPVADLIQTFKPETWEDFTEEWAVSQEQK